MGRTEEATRGDRGGKLGRERSTERFLSSDNRRRSQGRRSNRVFDFQKFAYMHTTAAAVSKPRSFLRGSERRLSARARLLFEVWSNPFRRCCAMFFKKVLFFATVVAVFSSASLVGAQVLLPSARQWINVVSDPALVGPNPVTVLYIPTSLRSYLTSLLPFNGKAAAI